MLKKVFAVSVLLMFSLTLFVGCGTDSSVYVDGTYTAISANADDKGYAEVTLTIKNDQIVDAKVVEYDGMGQLKDYETYGVPGRFDGSNLKAAHEALAAAFVESNTWEVDTVTGATGTSSKAMSAAKLAMDKAMAKKPGQNYAAGTFMAISDKTVKGWSIAWVTIENDEITEIVLAGTTTVKDEDGNDIEGKFQLKTEDYPWAKYHEAKGYIVENVLDKQSTEGIDAYTGATGSSNQWLQAIQRALDAASFK
jgi:uncharacterized protein with FMN-binding domain